MIHFTSIYGQSRSNMLTFFMLTLCKFQTFSRPSCANSRSFPDLISWRRKKSRPFQALESQNEIPDFFPDPGILAKWSKKVQYGTQRQTNILSRLIEGWKLLFYLTWKNRNGVHCFTFHISNAIHMYNNVYWSIQIRPLE